jgi:hypothetical protein
VSNPSDRGEKELAELLWRGTDTIWIQEAATCMITRTPGWLSDLDIDEFLVLNERESDGAAGISWQRMIEALHSGRRFGGVREHSRVQLAASIAMGYELSLGDVLPQLSEVELRDLVSVLAHELFEDFPEVQLGGRRADFSADSIPHRMVELTGGRVFGPRMAGRESRLLHCASSRFELAALVYLSNDGYWLEADRIPLREEPGGCVRVDWPGAFAAHRDQRFESIGETKRATLSLACSLVGDPGPLGWDWGTQNDDHLALFQYLVMYVCGYADGLVLAG